MLETGLLLGENVAHGACPRRLSCQFEFIRAHAEAVESAEQRTAKWRPFSVPPRPL